MRNRLIPTLLLALLTTGCTVHVPEIQPGMSSDQADFEMRRAYPFAILTSVVPGPDGTTTEVWDQTDTMGQSHNLTIIRYRNRYVDEVSRAAF